MYILLGDGPRFSLVFALGVSLLWGSLLPVPDARGQWTRHTIDSTSRGADGVRLADVNGDSHADVTTAWEEGGAVRVYVNPGPAQATVPWPSVTVGHVPSGEDAVLVDLDEDGATDVVSATEGEERTLYVHWAPTDRERYLQAEAWTTEAFPVTKDRQQWMFTLPMQIDDRHGTDLVVGSKGDSAAVGWLRAPDRPRALGDWRYTKLYDAGWIMTLRTVDMDDDGDRDVLVSDRYGDQPGILWLERRSLPPTDSVDWTTHRIRPAIETLFVDHGDIDGDGQADVLATERPRTLHLLLRRSNGWKHQSLTYDSAQFGTAKSIRTADLNQDGTPELLITCEKASGSRSGIFYLTRDGEQWRAHDIGGPEGTKFDRTELLDLDGDGDLDVLTCEERDQLGVIWYENPTR